MTKKLQNIISILKANQNEMYADGAFQYFIDNQIDVNELTEILKEEGIVLPVSIASQLKVNPGDYINVGENTIKVTSTSYQYFHPIAYLYKGELDRITSTYVTSILVNVTDEVEFLDKLSAENVQCLTVFSKSLRKDLTGIFDSINIFLVILIVFAL